jgi:hypothetical protein
MKITRTKLKRLIKEELNRINENSDDLQDSADEKLKDEIMSTLDFIMSVVESDKSGDALHEALITLLQHINPKDIPGLKHHFESLDEPYEQPAHDAYDLDQQFELDNEYSRIENDYSWDDDDEVE